jgi:hypothetical protein
MAYRDCPICGQAGAPVNHRCAPAWNCWDADDDAHDTTECHCIVYEHSPEGAACEAAAKMSDYGSERPFEGKLFVRRWHEDGSEAEPALLFDMAPSFQLIYEATQKNY